MRVFRGVSAAALAAVMAGAGVPATALEVNGPVDIPPTSFTGRQYVDSAGCVFVRAGVGSVVNWVARVGRDGSHLCGYEPTFGAPAAAVAAAPAAPPAALPAAPPAAVAVAAGAPLPTVALITAPPPAGLQPRPVTPFVPTGAPPVAVAAATAPSAPRPTAEQVPGPYVSPYMSHSGAVVAAPPAAPAQFAPVPVAQGAVVRPPAAPLPTIVATATLTNAQSVCPNLSPVAQRYMLSDGRNVVRCGPQTPDPVSYINGAGVPGLQVGGMNAPAALTAPIGVNYTAPMPQVATVPPVPAGYRPAWNDDRLNPYRGVASGVGTAQMAQRWNNNAPAQAVTQEAERGAVYVPEVVAPPGGGGGNDLVTSLSSKSAAAAAPATAPQGARYVQVGTYSAVENAHQARARLQGLGLPVAGAQVAQGGRALQVVYAGPFNSAEALRAALSAVRGAGYSDAFAR